MGDRISKNPHNRLNQFSWYAVQTKPGHEDKVCRFIAGLLDTENMREYIKEILIPTEVISEVKRGKKNVSVRKLFPGYIFINMLLYGEDSKILHAPWYFIRKVPGLLTIVGGDPPMPLTEKESQNIISQLEASKGKEIAKVQYNEGDEVKIMEGPFINLVGAISKVDSERGKLKVSVSIFGRSTLLEFEPWQVERNK